MESLIGQNRPVTQVLEKIIPNYFNYESLQFNFFFLEFIFSFQRNGCTLLFYQWREI